jgi:hypothetical protein
MAACALVIAAGAGCSETSSSSDRTGRSPKTSLAVDVSKPESAPLAVYGDDNCRIVLERVSADGVQAGEGPLAPMTEARRRAEVERSNSTDRTIRIQDDLDHIRCRFDIRINDIPHEYERVRTAPRARLDDDHCDQIAFGVPQALHVATHGCTDLHAGARWGHRLTQRTP